MAQPASGVGQAFISVDVVCAVEHNTGRTGVDQSLDAVLQAGIDDILSAVEVGAEVELPWAPHAGYGRCVEHRLDVPAGVSYGDGIAEITLHHIDIGSLQLWVGAATENADLSPVCQQLFNDVATEEATAAGDKTQVGHGIKASWSEEGIVCGEFSRASRGLSNSEQIFCERRVGDRWYGRCVRGFRSCGLEPAWVVFGVVLCCVVLWGEFPGL